MARYQFDSLSGACATKVLNLLQRVLVSALFVFVEFNGGSAKATVMTCCRPVFYFFSLFAPSFPSPPALLFPYYALCRYLVTLIRVVFVPNTAVTLFVWFCPCNSMGIVPNITRAVSRSGSLPAVLSPLKEEAGCGRSSQRSRIVPFWGP